MNPRPFSFALLVVALLAATLPAQVYTFSNLDPAPNAYLDGARVAGTMHPCPRGTRRLA